MRRKLNVKDRIKNPHVINKIYLLIHSKLYYLSDCQGRMIRSGTRPAHLWSATSGG